MLHCRLSLDEYFFCEGLLPVFRCVCIKFASTLTFGAFEFLYFFPKSFTNSCPSNLDRKKIDERLRNKGIFRKEQVYFVKPNSHLAIDLAKQNYIVNTFLKRLFWLLLIASVSKDGIVSYL